MINNKGFLPNGGGSGGGGGFNPPSGGGSGAGKSAITTTLITSTGGLIGIFGALLTPCIEPSSGNSFILTHMPEDFDTEEPAEYDYIQFAPENYEGRDVTINQIVLKYREIGKAKFSVNITVFNKTLDDFETVQIPVVIPQKALLTKNRKQSFPDNRIHTIRLAPPRGVIQGERPQITITRDANSGPISITKLTICGNMDEVPLA